MIDPDVWWEIPLKFHMGALFAEPLKPGSLPRGEGDGHFRYSLGSMKRMFLVSTIDRRFEIARCSSDLLLEGLEIIVYCICIGTKGRLLLVRSSVKAASDCQIVQTGVVADLL